MFVPIKYRILVMDRVLCDVSCGLYTTTEIECILVGGNFQSRNLLQRPLFYEEYLTEANIPTWKRWSPSFAGYLSR